MQSHRKPADAVAVTVMLVLCITWGFNQVTIKWAADGISLVMQAAVRSGIAALLLLAWARLRGIPLFQRDGTLLCGLVAGFLFAAEFGMYHAGLKFTTASRMIVFLYLTPCLTALGLAWFIPGERLRAVQWVGIALAFGGILTAFGEGFFAARQGAAPQSGFGTAPGDTCGIIAAFLWAATTVVIRTTPLNSATPAKTLFYQLAFAAVTLPFVSLLLGEAGFTHFTPKVVASIAFQGVLVAFVSYLAWFWLLSKYLATRLSVFSFMTPLFGVGFGVLLLGDPVSPAFLAAALLVGGGIALVNLRG
jgi:drug/metabolite transporter (DMT)-like permease